MNKLLIIGPASVHITNFISIVEPLFNEITLITDGAFPDNRVNKIYVVKPQITNPIKAVKLISELKKIIQYEHPDIIHIHQITRLAYFSVRAINKNIPTVATAWGSDVLLMPQKNILYKYMVRYVLKNVDYYTADSENMINTIKPLLAEATPHKYVIFGIIPISFDLSRKENIIYSNRLHRPLYNIDKVISDFYAFHQKHPEWRLIVAAEGPLTNNLKKQAQSLGIEDNISFVGWLNNEQNRHYYSISKIYISIPDSDGTSVSMLEAFSAGCIPIVSDLPVSREWVKNNENGIIRNGKNNCFEQALRMNIEKVVDYNAKQIKLKATREKARIDFSQIYQNVFQQGK